MKHFTSTNVDRLSRRDFLKITTGVGISAAGMTLLEACGVKPATPITPTPIPEDAPLETTIIRLLPGGSICTAPLLLAEDLLKAEGFTQVQYTAKPFSIGVDSLGSGEIDIMMDFVSPIICYLDTNKPLTILAGIHVGCFELFGVDGVNVISDLKGKTVAIFAQSVGSTDYAFLSSMLAYVGLDPNKDVTWVVRPEPEAKQLFVDGKVDAYLAFPPIAQELQARKIGHVVLNSMMDKPWSQYYCCMMISNRDFAQKNPVAAKRALRAILKATDICALEPERAAKFMVHKGYAGNYDYALDAMKNVSYNKWRELDPEDTLRFYSLRLREVGMIKSNPDQIIKQGSDWTFLNELKSEIKA